MYVDIIHIVIKTFYIISLIMTSFLYRFVRAWVIVEFLVIQILDMFPKKKNPVQNCITHKPISQQKNPPSTCYHMVKNRSLYMARITSEAVIFQKLFAAYNLYSKQFIIHFFFNCIKLSMNNNEWPKVVKYSNQWRCLFVCIGWHNVPAI